MKNPHQVGRVFCPWARSSAIRTNRRTAVDEAIAKKNGPYVGKGGSLIPNVAEAVAEGIKIGRKQGLELPTKALDDLQY